VLLSITLAACKKDDDTCSDPTNPDCENYDPCHGNEPTAAFKMRSTSVGFTTPENLQAEWCDTIYRSGVEFRADMEGASSYEWQIGDDSTIRTGKTIQVGFSSYTEDTLANINPDNPDFYQALDVNLTVRNESGACVSENDTLLSSTRLLVFTKKTLTIGTFRGKIEGEDTIRDVIFWRDGENLSNPNFNQQYFSDVIGLNGDDTLRRYWIMGSFEVLFSYKKRKWVEELNEWWIATDGIQVWDQTITTFPNAPDRVDLYYERIPQGSSDVEIVRFSGVRI
jgi:hypothetical protein